MPSLSYSARSVERRRRRSHQVLTLQLTRVLAPRAAFRGCIMRGSPFGQWGLRTRPSPLDYLCSSRPPWFLLKNCASSSQGRERWAGCCAEGLELWSVISILDLYSFCSLCVMNAERNRRREQQNGRAGVATGMDEFV